MELFKKPGDSTIGFEDSFRGLRSLKDAGCETKVLVCQSDHPQLDAIGFGDYIHFTSIEAIPHEMDFTVLELNRGQ